jgi:hypothetical protein
MKARYARTTLLLVTLFACIDAGQAAESPANAPNSKRAEAATTTKYSHEKSTHFRFEKMRSGAIKKDKETRLFASESRCEKSCLFLSSALKTDDKRC